MPTRLLDWSESALVGLYFAAYQEPDLDGALWVLSPCDLNESSNIRPDFPTFIPGFDHELVRNYQPSVVVAEKTSQLKPIAVLGQRNTARMQAQLGTFTVMHRDTTPLDAIDGGKHVVKILIPKEAKAQLLDDIRMLGVHELQLFPELPSLGNMLRSGLER